MNKALEKEPTVSELPFMQVMLERLNQVMIQISNNNMELNEMLVRIYGKDMNKNLPAEPATDEHAPGIANNVMYSLDTIMKFNAHAERMIKELKRFV